MSGATWVDSTDAISLFFFSNHDAYTNVHFPKTDHNEKDVVEILKQKCFHVPDMQLYLGKKNYVDYTGL